MNLTLLPALEEIPLPSDLDQEAQGLSQALNRAYSGAAKRTTGRNTGHPWWDLDCKAAASRNRKELSVESARNLRNTVRKAKNSYWATKLDNVTGPIDVFRMTKWHQSTGIYRSPPLKDPQHPENPPARSLEEKRNLLVSELLTNSAEAGDISDTCPTAATRSIDFPLIMSKDIYKLILKAGNITLKVNEILTIILQVA